jgi:hypothetical protein
MTATEGGPALHGADIATPAGTDGESGVTARWQAPRLLTVLGLARAEASLLLRSVLVLTGLLAGGATIWILIGPEEPVWWNIAWRIGFGQLVLGMAVLVAAHLAAARARRNAMADLYASFPVTAGTRTLAHLAGLAGAAPASLVLIGAAAVAVQVRGAVGTPSITVLAGGLLLVITAGAAGIAIASRFPHPLAGVLAALALLLSSGTSHTGSGGAIWLLPWQWTQDELRWLPGPLPGYPPAGAHVLELAGIAVLAVAAALAATVSRAWARGALATAGVLAVAVICLAGAVQLRPIPTAELNHLVAEATDPAAGHRCTTTNQVRYCLYPGFGPLLPSLEAPVNGVLARLPARPSRALTVSQVVSLSTPDTTLMHGHSQRQVSRWEARLEQAPANAAAASAVYLPVGSWPVAGGQLADAHFDVALATAVWAVRIPPQAVGSPASEMFLPCVPADQAREAIAIWLAILATRPPASELQAGLAGQGFDTVQGVRAPASIWNYPGEGSYLDSLGPQTTAAGYLLAKAMTNLPEQKVARVLTDAWARWLNWRTTDAQLATALGIRMPSVPTLPKPPPGEKVTQAPNNGPQNPLCTS